MKKVVFVFPLFIVFLSIASVTSLNLSRLAQAFSMIDQELAKESEWNLDWGDKPDWYDKPMKDIQQFSEAMTDDADGWLDMAIEKYKSIASTEADDQQKAEVKQLVKILKKAKNLADQITKSAIGSDVEILMKIYE